MRLRDLIVEGAYTPGQRLAHGRLMQSLGVGRTPLRTALSRLEGDGLVVSTPNQGVVVAPTPLSSGDLSLIRAWMLGVIGYNPANLGRRMQPLPRTTPREDLGELRTGVH